MQRHIPSLDGIRAVAVVIVFLSHVGLGHVVPGGFGVTIFFFLSGFLITTLLLKEQDSRGDVAVGAFFLRRLLRLSPPLFAVLALVYAGTWLGLLEGEINLATALSQIFYYFNYYVYLADPAQVQFPKGTDVLWSLSVEEHFYIGFVFLFVALHRSMSLRRQLVVLLAICALVLIWRSFLVMGQGHGVTRIFKTTDTRLDSILFGCVLAYLDRCGLARRLFGDRHQTGLFLFWTASGLGLLLLCFVLRDETFRYTLRYSLQGLAFMPLFYFAVTQPDRLIFRPLNYSWMQKLGLVSYTFYLIHYVIISALGSAFADGSVSPRLGMAPYLALVVLAFCLAFVFSLLVFRYVERPFNTIRHRLSRVADSEQRNARA